MLELKECCRVPFPEKLFEGYEIKENAIYANVNASKILEMMKSFIRMHDEPLFFILEIPSKCDDGITQGKMLINANDDYDVYFIDGLDAQNAFRVLDILGDFLVRDGLNTFGIGGHLSNEEILFGKYNVMTIYTMKGEAYASFFDSFGIERTDNLITAWDTFDANHGGECKRYISKETGKTIYDIPETFKDSGMYFYETRKGNKDEAKNEITYDELLGKVLLVGITFYTQDNEYIEQKQYHGIVTEANDRILRMRIGDGSEITLPPDLSSTKRAHRGEYKLRSTGEVVVDPDFLATWNLFKCEDE